MGCARKTLAAWVGGALALVGCVEALAQPAVFTPVQGADPARLAASLPADDDRQRLVRVDKGVLAAAQAGAERGAAQLTLDIAEGVALQAVVEHTAPTLTGYSLSGRIATGGVITWVVSDERLTGTIWTPVATYEVVPQSGGIHAIRKVDPSVALPPGEPLTAEVDWIANPPLAETGGDDGSRVDVLVFWTPAARSRAGSASLIRTAIDLYVATTNDALRNSGTNLQIRLVGSEEVAYVEVPGDSNVDLERLRRTTDGHMDAIHARRDALKADLVSLITSNIDVGGIAFVMRNLSVGFAPAAFSVVTYSAFPTVAAMAFAHELGHNMGLAHDRFVTPVDGIYPFARGYVNAQAFLPGANASACWYTLMAYSRRCASSGFVTATRVPYFSTPQLRYPSMGGDALGVSKTSDADGHDGPAHAALAIEQARQTVANFRFEQPADDGDTRAGATAVPAASSTVFAALDAGDVDYFRIQLTQASTLRTTSEGRVDTVGTLLSAEGVALATDDDSGARRNFLIERPLAAGTYFVKVEGFESATGSYALVVLPRPVSATDDHGDTAASSTLVAIPSTTAATLADARDVDYFRFELSERRLLEATTSGDLDTVGMLRIDGDRLADVVWGDETATDDDSGAAGNFKIAGKFDAGVYRLAVRGWNGAHGTTTLRLSFGTGADDHGDSPTAATALSLPARVAGELEALFDRDTFRIAVAERGLLRFGTEGEETDTFGILAAADGRTIASNDDGPDWPNFLIRVAVEPGIYFLRLKGWHLTTGPYLLTGSFDAAPAVARRLADLSLEIYATRRVNLAAAFRDPEGADLAYAARSSAEAVARATVSGATVSVSARSAGTATVTVTATDPNDLSTSQSFAVRVYRPNQPPSVARELADLTLALAATAEVDLAGAFRDPEGASLAYAARSSAEAVARATASGETVAVLARSAGTATVTVTATDPGGLSASQSFAVRVYRPNQPPQVAQALADLMLVPDATAKVDLADAFRDPEGAALAFTARSSAEAVARATASGTTLTVVARSGGEATVTVTATDPGGLSASQSFVVAVRLPPSIERELADLTLARGTTAEVDLAGAFRDPEGGELAYSTISSAASVASVALDGTLLTIAARSLGEATITVTATDPDGLAAAQSFAATVAAPPTAKPVAPIELAANGESAEVKLAAVFNASPGGAPLTFSATSTAPSLATATVFYRLLTVTANDDGEVGTLEARVTATDRRGLSATVAIGVEVSPAQRLLRGWRIEVLRRQRDESRSRRNAPQPAQSE